MIGHCTCFRENDDLPVWRGPAIKIMHELMHSRDLQIMKYWGMTLIIK